MTGETPGISECLDFEWYYRVWFKEDTDLREIEIGQFLGPSHKVGSLMRYGILPASEILVLITTVQRVIYLETCTDASKQRFKVYEKATKERFHKKYTEKAFTCPNSTNPTMEMWADLAEDNEDFQSEFNKVFTNPAVKEEDEEFTPDLHENYISMELTLD